MRPIYKNLAIAEKKRIEKYTFEQLDIFSTAEIINSVF